jgi:ATP-binding cassette, subfamily B, bacterial
LPLKLVFDHVLKNGQPLSSLKRTIFFIGAENKTTVLALAAASVILIAVLGAASSYANKYLTTTVGQWIAHDLRRSLYSHIQRLSLAYHDQKRTGDLISRVTVDIDSIQSFITTGLIGALVNILTITGMIIIMAGIHWQFTLIALSVVPALVLVVYTYTRRIKKAARDVRKIEGEIASFVAEALSSMRVVKAFAREDYELKRLEARSLENMEIALQARTLKAKLTPIVEIIVAIGTCLVLWFGVRMVLAGSMSTGSLIVFIFYLGKMYKPIQDLSKITDSYSRASIGFERIREVLETNKQIIDLPGARVAPSFSGRIQLDNVSFSYDARHPVLKNINLRIEPGQIAALVGPTGAGKTTIISLIPRFYDPDSGIVRIDGHDIQSFYQKTVRQQISYVLQETLLFHAPIWENIAYGKPEASRSEILRAAELANAREFIEKLPDAYDTMVGERGVSLSGGQRQRIAIARAIIRNTPILILDEPSTGLDIASEKLVFDALDHLMQGKTAIVIAHRLSTIHRADIIFVVNNGEIIEHGKHEDLLKRNGLYARHYEMQFERS